MTTLPYSKKNQIKLLLARKLFAEIDRLFPDAPSPWKLLTITKLDVSAYLEAHPGAAADFFAQAGSGDACPNWHDAPAVWKDAGSYKVAWLDHGKPVDAVACPTLEDAVARYISLRYLGG